MRPLTMNRGDPPRQNPRPSTRLVRTTTVLAGSALVSYALSDHPFYGGAPGFGAGQRVILAAGVLLVALVFLPATWNRRLLLLSLSGAVALLLAEALGEPLLAARFRKPFVADPELIFKLTPGSTFVTRIDALNGGGKVIERINPQGFRGEDLLPAGSATRIVVYGDSFIHAAYSPLEDTFPHQLSVALKEQLDQPIEVVNAGVSSYGPDQVLKKLQRELPGLRPDLVIVAVFSGNDYGDLLRNKMFRLGEGDRLIENRWELAPDLAVAFDLNARGSILLQTARELLRQRGAKTPRRVVPDDLTGMLGFCLAEAQREYDDYIVAGSNIVHNAAVDYFSADVSLDPESPSAEYRVRLMKAVLGAISDTVRAAGVPTVFMAIPHPLDACGEFRDAAVDAQVYPAYDRENLTAPLVEFADLAGLPLLDLLEVFREELPGRLYRRGADDHWNAAGQRLAARLMAEYLLTNGYLED